jgi:hypothetical protein
MDACLELGIEGYSPDLLRKIVSQGGRYAYEEAAHNLNELAGLAISAQHVMRLTERTGDEWAEQRDKEVEAHKQNSLARTYTHRPQAAAVMLDGGRVQTRSSPSGPGVSNPKWQEPKYGCFLTLNTKASTEDPQPQPPEKFLDRKRVNKLVRQLQSNHSQATSRREEECSRQARKKKPRSKKREHRGLVRTVIATMAGVDDFGDQVAVEVHKRGLDLAQRKACVCDGQASNWTVFNTHLKNKGFVPILDFLHLLSYLYAAAHAAGGSKQQGWDRYQKWVTWAWQGQRDKVMLALNAAVRRAGPPPKDASETDRREVLSKTQTYVANNLEKMDYPRYRKLGLPISSAPVESVIKQFNKRVKGTEKFWRSTAVEYVLQVRAAQLCMDAREDRLWANRRCA